MKSIILGDVHLGRSAAISKPGVGGEPNSRIVDQQIILDWVLAKAIALNVNEIIVTGDVFEEWRALPSLITMFMTWIKKCERAYKTVRIIMGNHEINRTGSYIISALDIIPALELAHAVVYKDITTIHHPGISYTFMPYRDRRMYDASSPAEALEMLKKELSGHLESIPKENKKIIVGHLTLEGALYVGDEIDDMLNEIICPLEMFAGYDYVWMGHIHNFQILSPNTPLIGHIGSMDRSDFSKAETKNDKYIIIQDENGFDQIPIPTRNLRKIDINVSADKDTTDYIINFLHAYNNEHPLKDAIVKIDVQLDGQETLSSDRDKIFKFLYKNLEVHHVHNFSESRSITPIQPSGVQALFDNNMNLTMAVDAWLPTQTFIEQDEVKQFMYECIEEFKAA